MFQVLRQLQLVRSHKQFSHAGRKSIRSSIELIRRQMGVCDIVYDDRSA